MESAKNSCIEKNWPRVEFKGLGSRVSCRYVRPGPPTRTFCENCEISVGEISSEFWLTLINRY